MIRSVEENMFNGLKKIVFIAILPITLLAQGTGVQGSYRMFHVQEARTFESGRMVFFSGMGFYTGTKPSYVKDGSAVPASVYWDASGNIALSYGVSDHFDGSLIVNLYQDTQVGDLFNLPSDIVLGLKAGNFEIGSGQFRWGVTGDIQIGLGKYYDVLFETYNPGGFQFGLGGALSYYSDPYLPGKALNAHLNLGYWSFNDAGTQLRGSNWTRKDVYVALNNSSALRYGLGVDIPVDLFDITFELWGSNYITAPDSFAYGAENYLYITPGFKYYPLSWMKINFGLDFLLVGKEEETTPKISKLFDYPSNYASWKVQMGLEFKIMPLAHGATEAEVEKQQFDNKIEFFESVIEERRRTETIEDELDKLKTQRRQAEKELEELRQLLDEQEN